MCSAHLDLSIFNKFNFKYPPVGVQFLFNKPQGIEPLDNKVALCETLKEAQKGIPFYYSKKNEVCAGGLPLGMEDVEPLFASGQLGQPLGVFKEARANRRVYQVLPKLDRNTVNYVAFSTINKLSFDPDLLIFTANPSQAELILRASSYTTGKMWVSKTTPVMGCAWLYVYPYISGELNYIVTGLCWGMKALRVFPEGLILISVPFDLLPAITENLDDMQWVPPSFTDGRDGYIQRFNELESEIRQYK